MHDVGKIGIPDAVLLNPRKLDPEEWEIMKKHTTIGARILHGSPSPVLQAGEAIALSHHERWDGSGYPVGLSGEGTSAGRPHLRRRGRLRRPDRQPPLPGRAAQRNGLGNDAG